VPVGITRVKLGDRTCSLTDLQAKVFNQLVKSGDKSGAERILDQCALDVPEGLQVPPGGASNAPIGDQAPKPGDEGQPDKSPPNVSSSVVDSRPATPKAGTPAALEAATKAAAPDAETAGKVKDEEKEPVPGELDEDKNKLLKGLELK
jgi:hypothetical protein